MYLRTLVAAVAALALCAAPAAARSGGHHGDGSGLGLAPISAEDFLTQAAAANRFEIITGRLAQQRAESADVRALGAEFVAHHTEQLALGAAVAAQLGITVPEELTPMHQRAVAKLQRLSGRRFDRVWIKVQLRAHEQALVLHLRGAIRGEKPEIRTLAQGGLPVITQHYGQLIDLVTADHGGGHGGWNDDGDDGHRHGGRRHARA
jgi:putative membrane protein